MNIFTNDNIRQEKSIIESFLAQAVTVLQSKWLKLFSTSTIYTGVILFLHSLLENFGVQAVLDNIREVVIEIDILVYAKLSFFAEDDFHV